MIGVVLADHGGSHAGWFGCLSMGFHICIYVNI